MSESVRPGAYTGRRRAPSSEFPSVGGEQLIPVEAWFDLPDDADDTAVRKRERE